MLTITTYGEGKCSWCLTTGEGVEAQFKDGLRGFLCKKHFWEALKARGEGKEIANAQGEASRRTA